METFTAVRSVLLFTLVLNLLVTAAKMVVGYLTGSLSILADGFDSLFDGVTNVIGLIAIYLARRPPDDDHPYGHRRYETLMTLAVSVLLFFTCYTILQSAYQRLKNPSVPDVNVWSFAALLFSIAVHLYTARYEIRRGRELKSEFLIADASHTSADILVSFGVIVGLVVVRLGYAWVDAAVAVAIAIIIAKIGLDIIRSSTRILTDSAAVEAAKVVAILEGIAGVESYHRIRSRGQADDIRLDLHVRVAPELPVTQAHAIAHDVQRRIQEAIDGARDVVVHVEPQPGEPHPTHDELFEQVKRVARHLGIPVHHLNAVAVAGRYSLELHLEVPEDLSLGQAHAKASRLENEVRARIPKVADIHTHIEPAAAALPECDEVVTDSEREQTVRRLACSVPGVRDSHGVRFHTVGDQLVLTLNCLVDEHLPIAQAHDVATRVEERLRSACPDIAGVSVHIEPTESDPPH